MTLKHGLYAVRGLSLNELLEIEVLAAECNAADQLDLKLNWSFLRTRPKNQTNDFLYYEQGKLVGYLPIFCFNLHEAEVSGMVSPQWRRQKIFSRLLAAAREECLLRKIPSLLFIVEHSSASGQAFVASLQPDYDHSEYKMRLDRLMLPATLPSSPLQFRPAQKEDRSVLTHITARAFEMNEHAVDWYSSSSMNDAARIYYLAFLGDTCVGKIDVYYGAKEAFISGFGVLPEYQRQGYGRQILTQTLQAIQQTGPRPVVLEVEVKNEHALDLYLSYGFKQTSRYDYYRLVL
ncbi:GNAT family N-acetyltransferase [Dictyobacter arantiisoli]|uniref:GNAT family N-acetyltransferase n=1 Tax=Dictyobacter arantiisoli TaxID=2014874 RepID=A0A5A5TI49_9CHLR|nr:GNAT family N-acetyltransferase [Dictyobacter arantiisoli]GCF10689.1 GNAT family N-acetyltransferase [Dictyobacter arantiisoli]